MREMILSLQDWEIARRSVNEGIKKESGDEIFKAFTVILGGIRYVSFEANFGPYHNDPTKALAKMHSWRVVPACEYEGVVFRNFEALSPNVPGLIIISGDEKYVCVEYVLMRMGLPSTPILPMNEALAMNAAERRIGWRYLMYEGVEPKWDTFCGHPVVIYPGEQSTVALLWKSKFGVLHDYIFDDGVVLDSRRKEEYEEEQDDIKDALFVDIIPSISFEENLEVESAVVLLPSANGSWRQLKLFI